MEKTNKMLNSPTMFVLHVHYLRRRSTVVLMEFLSSQGPAVESCDSY